MICTVYGDLLFFTEFFMDLVLLLTVMRFGNFPSKPANLLGAAFFGGSYGLLSVFPTFLFFREWYWKFICSFLIVKIAFPKISGKRYLIALLYFYLIGFAMAGAVICLSRFFGDEGIGESALPYTAIMLFGAFLPIIFISLWREKRCLKTVYENQLATPVTICYNGKKTELFALFDTGNELVDPVTKLPVVVVEYDAVRSLIPSYLQKVLANENLSPDRIFSKMQTYPISSRLRLIPYSSLGQSHGLMLGMRPDKICFTFRGKKEINKAVIGFYRGTLQTKENCSCIVNPLLLETE